MELQSIITLVVQLSPESMKVAFYKVPFKIDNIQYLNFKVHSFGLWSKNGP